MVLAILPSLQCATEREALNISVFFMELLHLFGFWNEEQKLRNEFRKYSAELLEYEQSKFYILVTHQKIVNIMNILFNKYKVFYFIFFKKTIKKKQCKFILWKKTHRERTYLIFIIMLNLKN